MGHRILLARWLARFLSSPHWRRTERATAPRVAWQSLQNIYGFPSLHACVVIPRFRFRRAVGASPAEYFGADRDQNPEPVLSFRLFRANPTFEEPPWRRVPWSGPKATVACQLGSEQYKQALQSERVRSGLRDILLGPAQHYEALRERAGTGPQ